MNGIELIARERQRQIKEEGFALEHDDGHAHGNLALVAALFATPVRLFFLDPDKGPLDPWPLFWDKRFDKRPRNEDGHITPGMWVNEEVRVELLTKSGALIAAEIDRLQRRIEKKKKGKATS